MPKSYTMRLPDLEASNWFQERTQGGALSAWKSPLWATGLRYYLEKVEGRSQWINPEMDMEI